MELAGAVKRSRCDKLLSLVGSEVEQNLQLPFRGVVNVDTVRHLEPPSVGITSRRDPWAKPSDRKPDERIIQTDLAFRPWSSRLARRGASTRRTPAGLGASRFTR